MFIFKNGVLVPTIGTKRVKVQNAVMADEAVSKGQFEGDANTTSGNNTHTGTETFSNATGVTTNIISERTAGVGTSIKTPIYTVTGATLTSATTPAISASTSGATYSLAKADGQTITLPACSATNIGIRYRFVITVTCTSVGYVINTTGTDVFIGAINSLSSAGAAEILAASTTNKTITLDASTKGGLIGGWVEVTCVSATQWHVSGLTLGTGVIATPFSN